MWNILQNLHVVWKSNADKVVSRSRDCLVSSLLALAVLSLAVTSHAQVSPSGSLKRSPAEVVKRYVLLDQKGARLDAPSFDTLTPYINWKEEPAWGRVVVVEKTDVPDDYRKWEILNNLEVVIPVTFQVRGAVYLESATFIPEDTTEEVRFHVKVVGNYWRIVSPIIPPHVGLKRMVSFAREAEANEENKTHRTELASLIDSLRKAK
ncbi:MAG: hypothetical protein Nkreftii_000632 [Candidatus Nitrospira kreftii]|uniref:Uncharacterized protein n=1 Tax=Candidatus Nitrospira kreftii TaxID=2652173 RepID=A0A7S8FBL7_9BACT|nr:MAG: hypothetical protein Nkreftii_000632 [Candidatus Nitrospira kreftii]